MAALIASGAGVLVSAPAQAGQLNGVCEDSEFCVYRDAYLSGGVADYEWGARDYSQWTFYGSSTTVNDNVSSVKNEGNILRVRIWEHANYSGRLLDVINQNTEKWTLPGYDNTASSHEFFTG
ncbi:hypothetical protein SD37_33420 [Amycolatopsis orientalis]|uniref:Peptidase inhibitor family I36 n=1 Tax=Amycolatopsis orientalis TaxID=31958 RepID=A0A193C6R9_AMYOR|nr:hypothetical protein SD37_33420 [Amycolatopsis orientalis]